MAQIHAYIHIIKTTCNVYFTLQNWCHMCIYSLFHIMIHISTGLYVCRLSSRPGTIVITAYIAKYLTTGLCIIKFVTGKNVILLN